jgi:hypothetical protein
VALRPSRGGGMPGSARPSARLGVLSAPRYRGSDQRRWSTETH